MDTSLRRKNHGIRLDHNAALLFLLVIDSLFQILRLVCVPADTDPHLADLDFRPDTYDKGASVRKDLDCLIHR